MTDNKAFHEMKLPRSEREREKRVKNHDSAKAETSQISCSEAYKKYNCIVITLFHTIRFSCNLHHHHSAFINPPSSSSPFTSLLSAMAASTKLCATILVLYLLACSTFTEACGSCKPPKPKPCPTPAPKCPLDTLKLGVCADVLGLVNVVVGSPPTSKCCPLLEGLADLEAALCLCTAIKANVLGINLNVPLSLSLILSSCQKSVPPGFQCP